MVPMAKHHLCATLSAREEIWEINRWCKRMKGNHIALILPHTPVATFSIFHPFQKHFYPAPLPVTPTSGWFIESTVPFWPLKILLSIFTGRVWNILLQMLGFYQFLSSITAPLMYFSCFNTLEPCSEIHIWYIGCMLHYGSAVMSKSVPTPPELATEVLKEWNIL